MGCCASDLPTKGDKVSDFKPGSKNEADNGAFKSEIYSKASKDAQKILQSLDEFDDKDYKGSASITTKEMFEISKGEWYNGQWDKANDCPEGYGVYVYADGNIYEGHFIGGKREGTGRQIYTDSYYEGEFKADERNGRGVYKDLVHGGEYEGGWKDGDRSGEGKEKMKNGSTFEGTFEDGEKQKGILIFANGNKYEGQFVNNTLGGEGTMTFADGRTAKGHWTDNKMNGQMVYDQPGKGKYTGRMKLDKRHGWGTFEAPDYTYEGTWKDNKMNGVGCMTKGGKQKYAEWENGTLKKNVNKKVFEKQKAEFNK